MVKVIYDKKTKEPEIYKLLERKMVSFCFAYKLVLDDVEKFKIIIEKQYSSNNETISKEELQRLIFDYLAHIDSALDYFDKFICNMKAVNVKYQRKLHKFDSVINDLRNDTLHEGIPRIIVTYPCDDYNNSFSCCQSIGEFEKEEDQTIYIEIEMAGKHYDLDSLIKQTYNPLICKVKEIFLLIEE